MRHADIRLQERTFPVVADRAYELLRDRPRLAEFVQRKLTAMGAADASRVAMDLEDAVAPARLVVTQDGHPVTCLAAGMVTNTPVLRWDLTSVYLETQSLELRARMAVSRVPEEEHESVLERLKNHPHRITRAEFDVLTLLAPLLVKETSDLLRETFNSYTVLLSRSWNVDEPLQRRALEARYRIVPVTALLMLATRNEPLADALPLMAMDLDDATVARVGWWLMMNDPRRSMDTLVRVASGPPERAPDLRVMTVVWRCLNALATRYPWLETEACEPLSKVNAILGMSHRRLEEMRAAWRAERRLLQGEMLRAMDWLVTLDQDEPCEASARFRAVGAQVERLVSGDAADLAEAAARLGPAHAALARDWMPLDRMAAEPRRHLLPEGRLSTAELEGADRWRRLWSTYLVPLDLKNDMVGVVFSFAPPEAVVPDDRFRHASSLRERLAALVQVELPAMRRERAASDLPTGPVTVAPKPGPNAPCTCGSGKKFKKCCGAA